MMNTENNHFPHKILGLFLLFVLLLTACQSTAELNSQSAKGSSVATNQPVQSKPFANHTENPSISNPVTADDGIEVGFTKEGYPYRGSAEAPVTLIEYSDYLCPFCKRHFSDTYPSLLEKYIKTGKVKHIFRDYPIQTLHPTAPQGHVAALCVAEQGPELFWKMHDSLYQNQDQWNQLPDPNDFLRSLAQGIGADMAAYDECITSGRTVDLVNKGVQDSIALGFNGTPSFQFVRASNQDTFSLMGAYPFDTFAQWIDALVAGKDPPQEEQAQTEKPELPFWAKPEGLAPDPSHPGFTVAGDPFRGNPEAKMVVVEFSDFQCPACQSFFKDVQPGVDKAFVDNGDVMWVFKNLPLKIHPQSPAAAVAAECAGDQGKFWEMHDLLFQKVEDWSNDNPDPELVTLARDLSLDESSFKTCLESRKTLERVLADLYDAQGIVTSTPTFIALFGGQGTVIQGTKPLEEFQPILQALLDKASNPGSSQ